MGFRMGSVDGRAVLADGDHVYDVEAVSGGEIPAEPRLAIAAHGRLHDLAAGLADTEPTAALADVALGPPVPWPRQVFGVGLNYRTHAAETGMALPDAPLVFTKFPGCLTGPNAGVALASDTTDYEAELVVVIGERCKDVAVADAWHAVAGLMVGQDLSDRALQNAGDRPQFGLGKSHDGYGPTGPFVVSPDLVPTPDDLAIGCTVNGEVRQSDPDLEPHLLRRRARQLPRRRPHAPARRPDLHGHTVGRRAPDRHVPPRRRRRRDDDRGPRNADHPRGVTGLPSGP